MSAVYAVWVHYHDDDSQVPFRLIGIYTTRTLALQVAREARLHHDDETSIREHFLNQFGPGQTIWDHKCDDGDDYHPFYRRFWPTGMPSKT